MLLLPSSALLRANDSGSGHSATAQGGSANKLALILPTLFGPRGLILPNPDHEAHFDAGFRSNFTPLNTSLASQLTVLPIPSPASGFTYAFDPALGTYTRSAQSFGPVLAERAETIGKDKFYIGFTYQRFRFDELDGLDTSSINAVLVHQETGDARVRQDIITTRNFIDLQLAQFTTFFTYGLTRNIDVSVAVPFVSADLTVVGDAKIQRIGTPGDPNTHYFATSTGDRSEAQFSGAGSAAGLGDITLRIKGTVRRWENAALAAGLDTRLPTGDEYNFLGSGAYGVRPFLAATYRRGRFAPHANLGFQWNGSSVLAGNVLERVSERLPRQLSWVAGTDVGVSPKLTLAFDLLGQTLYNTTRVSATTFRAANNQLFADTSFRRANATLVDGSAGLKLNAFDRLLVTFNLLFPLNNAGLRSRVVPLVGVSYAF